MGARPEVALKGPRPARSLGLGGMAKSCHLATTKKEAVHPGGSETGFPFSPFLHLASPTSCFNEGICWDKLSLSLQAYISSSHSSSSPAKSLWMGGQGSAPSGLAWPGAGEWRQGKTGVALESREACCAVLLPWAMPTTALILALALCGSLRHRPSLVSNWPSP